MVIVGYTSGVFDLFHVGHLKLLKRAKDCCDILVVAVCTDKLAYKLKGKKPVICFEDRQNIVSALKCVDKVVKKDLKDTEFMLVVENHANIVFKGDDWRGTKKWITLEKEFKELGVEVLFFPYTKKVSSTKLRGLLK